MQSREDLWELQKELVEAQRDVFEKFKINQDLVIGEEKDLLSLITKLPDTKLESNVEFKNENIISDPYGYLLEDPDVGVCQVCGSEYITYRVHVSDKITKKDNNSKISKLKTGIFLCSNCKYYVKAESYDSEELYNKLKYLWGPEYFIKEYKSELGGYKKPLWRDPSNDPELTNCPICDEKHILFGIDETMKYGYRNYVVYLMCNECYFELKDTEQYELNNNAFYVVDRLYLALKNTWIRYYKTNRSIFQG